MAKIGNQVRQQVTRWGRAGADAQGAALQPAQRVLQRFGLDEGIAQPFRVAEQLLARCSQAHATAGTLIKRLAEFFLQQL